jgi:HTH-type transcriptional regulator / antitoxin HigA
MMRLIGHGSRALNYYELNLEMAASTAFEHNWMSAPGETITALLGQIRLSRTEFATRMGCTPSEIDQLLDGTASITNDCARRLQNTIGGSVNFWMRRESQFRRDLARIEETGGAGWIAELPVSEMTRFGWISTSSGTREQLLRCMNFFGVNEIDTWREKYSDVLLGRAFKTSSTFDSQPAAVAAWLRQAEIEATSADCKDWNPERFKNELFSIRTLTRQRRPNRFLPELKERCASCGVALVILRAPAGCRASGATWFLSATKAVIVLSFRYLSDDHFWFTFFHEAAHLLLHEHSHLFLEGADLICTKDEAEASNFAAKTLIPPEYDAELMRLPLDGRAVLRFAQRIRISPGIVVGQLQHRGRITHRQLNSLKTRFSWTSD